MGISDLFKRFKTNAASFEQSAEKRYDQGGAEESQAARAAHEGHDATEAEPANDGDDS
jgi:hypothetical protein